MVTEWREEYTSLLENGLKRDGADVNGLILYLDESEFFTSPASLKYKFSYQGGLCHHSLDTYYILKSITPSYVDVPKEDTFLILGLLHDIAKAGYYKDAVVNRKVYTANGSKHDELGRFDWVSERGYLTNEDFLFAGSFEDMSSYAIEAYIPLTAMEHYALVNYSGGLSFDSKERSVYQRIYSNNPYAVLLHAADTMSMYLPCKDL